jgi:hypothetical protein
VWAGAIGGLSRSAADVRFAAHPLGFVLLVAAWTAFGGFLVWFGWSGFVRSGDDADAVDDEARDTLPLPQPRSLPVPRPLRSPQAESLPPAVASSRPAASLPEPLVLYISRPWAVLVLVLVTVLLLGVPRAYIGLSYFLTARGAAILLAPGLVAYLWIVWKCARAFFWQGPALVLDRFGILDYRHAERHIPWTDVEAVRLYANDGVTSLVLRFRDLALARRHFGALNMLSALMNRIFYKGYEGRLVLTGLTFKRAQVLQVAQVFVRHARR